MSDASLSSTMQWSSPFSPRLKTNVFSDEKLVDSGFIMLTVNIHTADKKCPIFS